MGRSVSRSDNMAKTTKTQETIHPNGPSWSARCDCYNGHQSSSGRCLDRNDGREHEPAEDRAQREAKGWKCEGVYDPTQAKNERARCSYCRSNCRQN